jgi:hypothetical protein
LHYGFYKIDLECGDKNAVKPTLAEVFLGIRKRSLRKNDSIFYVHLLENNLL